MLYVASLFLFALVMFLKTYGVKQLKTHRRWRNGFLQAILLVSLTCVFATYSCSYLRIPLEDEDIYDRLPDWAFNVLKDKIWILKTELEELDTQMKIPFYLRDQKLPKPPKAPFDPRLTLAFYYDYISNNADSIHSIGLPFHWADWVDMPVIDDYILDDELSKTTCEMLDQRRLVRQLCINPFKPECYGAKDPNEFCRDVSSNVTGLGFEINAFPGRLTLESAVLFGRNYLYTLAPNPTSIVFLTSDGSYHYPVETQKESLLTGKIVPQFFERNPGARYINTLETFNELQETVSQSTVTPFAPYQKTLEHSDFTITASEELSRLELKRQEVPLNRHEEMFLDGLKISISTELAPDKYFYEAQVFDTNECAHYDWRFFSGFKSANKSSANSFSRLLRTWLSFTRKHGLNTWLAHGTLLAWHFNGMVFPWDDDADVQMPIKDLQELALRFNQSLIVENGEEGFGRYFLDCGTFITSRESTNGNNNIDARFIDVDTGLYIDITGLAVSHEKAQDRFQKDVASVWFEDTMKDANTALQLYNCRNRHFARLSELSPLRKTYFEGEVAYIPSQYQTLLTNEYNEKALTDYHYGGVVFVEQLRSWTSEDHLRFFLRFPKEWDMYYGPDREHTRKLMPPVVFQAGLTDQEVETILNFNETNITELLHQDELLLEYALTKELTGLHAEEIEAYACQKSTEAFLRQYRDFPPHRVEPFLNRMRLSKETFKTRVQKFQKKFLSSSYFSFPFTL